MQPPTTRSEQRLSVRIADALLPGRRAVWLAAGAVAAVLAAVLAVALLQPREYLTGSNSAAPVGAVAIVEDGQRLCVRQLRVPKGTGRVRFRLDVHAPTYPALRLEVLPLDGRAPIRTTLPAGGPGGFRAVDVPIPTTTAAPFLAADICLTPRGGRVFAWGRPGFLGNDVRPTVDGEETPTGRVSVWFLGPEGVKRSILQQLPDIFARAALFRPGFVGAWTYWVLFLAVLPLAGYGAVRLLATAATERARRVPAVLAVAALAFVNAGAWALITPAFQAPDESEHFVYAQYFAETGKSVDATPSDRPLYSSAESVAIDAVRLTGVIERVEGKPPWLEADVEDWRRRIASLESLPQDNGGGFHPAISAHSPVYYGMLAPVYWAAHDASTFAQLFWMRLLTAALTAVSAAMAFLTTRELLPRHPALAVAAGLLVAFQPMVTFISGAINNDNGVNAVCAIAIYLVVRALRRGLTAPLAIGLAAALVVAPLMKGTGYALYPPVLLGLAWLLWRRRRSARDWAALGAGLAAFVALQVGWSALASVFERPVFTTPGGATPIVDFTATHRPTAYLSWLWQVLTPLRLPFMDDYTVVKWPFYNIYIQRGFGSFGWYAIEFPHWVYLAIVAVAAGLGALGLRALWRYRLRAVLDGAVPFLVLVPVTVVCAVEAIYLPTVPLPIDGTPEQGRYLFPATVAIAALAAACCLGAGRRRVVPLASALVGAMIVLLYASRVLTIATFYS